MNLPRIAAAMRRQAEAGEPARRQLPGGLMLKFVQYTNAQDGKTCLLILTRRSPGPGAGEREQWRRAFGVPVEVFEYKGLQGEYIFVQYEWKEKKNGEN